MTPIDSIQRSLSVAQAVPILGPICVSPVKAVVSVAQLVVGLAKAIFFGTIALSAAVLRLDSIAGWSAGQMKDGFVGLFNGTCSLIYSNANMLTLGLVGMTCEALWYDSNRRNGRVCLI